MTGWTDNYVRVKFHTKNKLPKEFIEVNISGGDISGFCPAELPNIQV